VRGLDFEKFFGLVLFSMIFVLLKEVEKCTVYDFEILRRFGFTDFSLRFFFELVEKNNGKQSCKGIGG
jgi:hypothetical protein